MLRSGAVLWGHMGYFEKIWTTLRYFTAPEFILLGAVVVLFVVYARAIRRMRVRAVVLTAILCAAAGALGAALRGIPGVQPTSFLIIMTGVLMGPGAGLAAGVVSCLLFDLLTMITLYTPWRMAFWGVLGILSAYLPRKPWAYLPFGLAWGFIYGWIMNLPYMLAGFIPLNWPTFLAACSTSFVFDLTHGVCNAVLLACLYPFMLRLAERTGIRYERNKNGKGNADGSNRRMDA